MTVLPTPTQQDSRQHMPGCDIRPSKGTPAARWWLLWPALTVERPGSMVMSGPRPRSPADRCSRNVEHRALAQQLLPPADVPEVPGTLAGGEPP